jgi:GTP cyclohydrolase II
MKSGKPGRSVRDPTGDEAALRRAREQQSEPVLRPLARIRQRIHLPLLHGKLSGDVFSFEGLVDEGEHIAVGLGAWQLVELPLIRLHSECLTGDVFGSQKCDCGHQLAEGMNRIAREGGFLLYLRQEGRGIGLYNKLDAYALQAGGKDTFEANRVLGFADDLRDYRVAAQMLRALGHERIRLLSNNPEKEDQLRQYGVDVVARHPTEVHQNTHNTAYLHAKATHAGHDITLTEGAKLARRGEGT